MKTKLEIQMERNLKKEKNLSLQEDKKNDKISKQVNIIWHKLNYITEPKLKSTLNDLKLSYENMKRTETDLSPHANGSAYSNVLTLVVVAMASILDVFLWESIFASIDGLTGQIARAVGLVVAFFVAICCAGLGRSLKDKSILNNPIELTNETQINVFNKNTVHNYSFLFALPVGIASILIPTARYITTDGNIASTFLMTSISYMIFASVIAFEMFIHCIWTKELKKSKNDYNSKLSAYKHTIKQANVLGANLNRLDSNQNNSFVNFMNEFKLPDNNDGKIYVLSSENDNINQPKILKELFNES